MDIGKIKNDLAQVFSGLEFKAEMDRFGMLRVSAAFGDNSIMYGSYSERDLYDISYLITALTAERDRILAANKANTFYVMPGTYFLSIYDEKTDLFAEARSATKAVEFRSNCLERIGAQCFTRTSIECMEIPEGVTVIGVGAFSNCPLLQRAVIPGSIEKVESMVFSNCTDLQSVKLSDGIKCIGRGMFKGCTKLQSIDLPSSIEEIDERAFSGCTALQSIDLPASVKIKDEAFVDCISLQSVKLGESVKIDKQGFAGCTSLTEVNLPAGLTWGKVKGKFPDSPWGQTKPAKK